MDYAAAYSGSRESGHRLGGRQRPYTAGRQGSAGGRVANPNVRGRPVPGAFPRNYVGYPSNASVGRRAGPGGGGGGRYHAGGVVNTPRSVRHGGHTGHYSDYPGPYGAVPHDGRHTARGMGGHRQNGGGFQGGRHAAAPFGGQVARRAGKPDTYAAASPDQGFVTGGRGRGNGGRYRGQEDQMRY